MEKHLVFILLIFCSISTFSQNPPEEFFNGLDLLSTDAPKAKKEFQIALQKDSLFHGTHHFLGVIYLDENKIDSAINCFKKSIQLNTANVNHTKEMTYARLIKAYLYQQDFSNSFTTAWEAYNNYPENREIIQDLKDICLWAFYINHNELDSAYLSTKMQTEYTVNSVPEEYLIIRTIRIDDHYLIVNEQSLITENKTNYDIIDCNVSKNNNPVKLKFKLNWDMNKYYGGKVTDTKTVYSNSELPIYERIGALLVSDSKINLKKEIKKLMKQKK